MAGSASADTIVGLCGTGLAANCGALLYNTGTGAGGQADGNYTLYNLASNVGPYPGTLVGSPVVLSKANQFGPPNEWADYNTGRWISPLDSTAPDPGCTQNQNSTACSYQAFYEISFNIPLIADLSTVQIAGLWTADDQGNVVLNGTSLASNATNQGGALPDNPCANPPFCGASSSLNSFTLTSSTPGVSFHYGTNMIGFQVDQADDYFDGLDVHSLSGTYNDLSSTPEPGTLSLLAAGALALGMLRRRRA